MEKGQDRHVVTTHLVIGESLNHHDTLFAGQGALWMVECGFMETAGFLGTNEIVCLRVHGMLFKKPVRKGEVIAMSAKIIYTGKSSVGVYVKTCKFLTGEFVVDGYMTFVSTNHEGVSEPHGLHIVLPEEDKPLQEEYLKLRGV